MSRLSNHEIKRWVMSLFDAQWVVLSIISRILLHKFATLIIAIATWAALFQPANAEQKADSARVPNIVLILADDLGYGDLGCYGQKSFATPQLDELAKQGLRFTDYYAGSTVCAPSRCVLMTGYHTGHCLIRGNAKQDLRPSDVTLAEVLHSAGYRTGLFGKWGLGHEGSTGVPTKQGFDEFYGYLDQTHAHNYYPTFLMQGEERVKLKNVVPNETKVGAGKASEKVEYSHDLICDQALDFIRRSGDKPFFLYLAITLPHANNEAGKEGMEIPSLGEFADKSWSAPRKGHAAMVTRIDRDVRRVIEELKRQHLDKNTLVLFSSDNGPHNEGGYQTEMNDSNGPLRGSKRDMYEGGIRVPMIAWWPGKIAPGESKLVAGHVDLMPTLAHVVGAESALPKDLDGLSLAPTLLGKPAEQKQHDALYWAFYERGGAQAVRSGDWKLVEQPIGTKPQLYDLAKDVAEAHDLAEEHPGVVAKLVKQMQNAYVPSETWKFKEK